MFKFVAIFSIAVLFLACSSPEPEVITVVVTATPPPVTMTPTSTPAPEPTYTPVPTSTPVPTHTPTQTFTPQPTFTPVPTYTPTLTPIPTSTRVPTYTPRPTNTPTSESTFNNLLFSLYDCEGSLIEAELILLSQSQQNLLNITILGVYNSKEISRTKTRLDCSGEALLSISNGLGDLYPIIYWIELDPDGNAFIFYEIR